MKKRYLMILPVFALLSNGLRAQESKQSKPGKHAGSSSKLISKKNREIQIGIASFYANKFEGRKTANGERFSQKNMTAASNRLPLNTWVKVVNLRNKRSVFVRITDRMHPHNKRLIDLSRTAASKLGYVGRGLAKVKVEVMGKKYHPEEIAEVTH